MASTTNVTINDGAADCVFNPVSRLGDGTIRLLNKVGPIASAFKALQLGFSLWSARRATTKARLDLDVPLVRTDINGVASANDVGRIRIEVTIPKSATAAEQLAMANLQKNAAANAIWMAYVSSGDPMM